MTAIPNINELLRTFMMLNKLCCHFLSIYSGGVWEGTYEAFVVAGHPSADHRFAQKLY